MEPFKNIFYIRHRLEIVIVWHSLQGVITGYKNYKKLKLFSPTLQSCTNILLQSHENTTIAFQPVKLHVL